MWLICRHTKPKHTSKAKIKHTTRTKSGQCANNRFPWHKQTNIFIDTTTNGPFGQQTSRPASAENYANSAAKKPAGPVRRWTTQNTRTMCSSDQQIRFALTYKLQ